MLHLFTQGHPWPTAPLGPEGYVSVNLHGDTVTLLLGLEARLASASLRSALDAHRYSVGFQVDPPHLSVVIVDEHVLASLEIDVDERQSREIAKWVRMAKSRRVVVMTVNDGVIGTMVEKPSKASFWRFFGSKMRDPQTDPDLEEEAANLIWPPSRDVRPVCCVDGNWRLIGWRLS